MNRLLAVWGWARRNKLVILAGVLTGAEGLVAMGIDLPGSSYIPIKYRALAIFLLTVAAFVMRTIAQRRSTCDGGR